MPKIKDCLITASTALRVKKLMREHGHPVGKRQFLCPSCKRPVQPITKNSAADAHFEHLERNLDCPSSDKRTAKKLYAAHKASKAAKVSPPTVADTPAPSAQI
jgi:hypothetical protein